MENEKLHRISSFKEWLRGQKINEGFNPDTNINDKHKRNNVYGFAEYSELLREAYCMLQFDHYNSVIDNDHVLRAARNLFLYHIVSDIKKRFNYDDTK